MRKALFLDRDGILNKVVIREGVVSSPRSLDEFKINEDAGPLIESANRAGYIVVVVTNQPDVERNLLDARTLDPKEIAKVVRTKQLLDTRRHLNIDGWCAAGFRAKVLGLGRGS